MARKAWLIVVLLLAAACNGVGAEVTTAPTSTTIASVSSTSDTTIAPAPLGCEGAPDSYTADGPLGILGTPGADAQIISGIRLVARGECERFEVALSTDGGAPATSLPITEVEMLAEGGVLRITFDQDVVTSAITDSILEGALIERAYVVRSLDGALYVDAHLSQAVAARAFMRDNPVRVAVEVRPIEAPSPVFPLVGGLVVVTGPTAGSVEYPIIVTGYARTFEANVIARLLSDSGTETEVFTTAADHLEFWGEFEMTIDEGPGGDVTIFVGEDSAVDGTAIGVEFSVSAG